MLRSNWSFLAWCLIGVVVSAGFVYVANERSWPFVVEKKITVQQPVYEQKTELMEVTTQDGKKVKAFVPVPVMRFVEELREQVETYEPTPEQQLRLTIIKWIGVAIFALFVVLLILWVTYFFRKAGKPPKPVDDLFKYLVTGMVGAFLGFIGSPTGDSKAVPNAIGSSQPKKVSTQRPKAPQQPQ